MTTRELAHEHTAGCIGDFDSGSHTSKCKMLASAITAAVEAEKQRCIRIARAYENTEPVAGRLSKVIASVMSSTGKAIASDIITQSSQ